jgi:hypothetical protein
MADAWYYFLGGQQGGPVDDSVIREMLQTGRLAWTDLVWRDGLGDWKAAEQVPELATLRAPQAPAASAAPPPFVAPEPSVAPAAPPVSTAPTPAPEPRPAPAPAASKPSPEPAPAPVSAAPTPSPQPKPASVAPTAARGSGAPQPAAPVGSGPVSLGVIAALSKTRPWVRLVSVLVFIMCAFLVLAGIGWLVAGVSGGLSGSDFGGGAMGLGAGIGVAVLLVYLVIAALMLPVAVFLGRYASRIKVLQGSGRMEALEDALFAQKSFWKYVGVLTLINLIINVLAIIVLLVVGLGAFMSAGRL